MDASHPLPLLILSTLECSPREMTRYEIMIKVNHVAELFDSPYSPGATYHAIKSLLRLELIENNHMDWRISALGRAQLYQILTSSPLPLSWLHRAYRMIAACSCVDPDVRQAALRRISVEMIKFNQYAGISPDSEHSTPALEKALKSCHLNMSSALQKSILDIAAQ